MKPIVVGITDKQPHVLRFAAREAGLLGAPLRVLHAVGLTPKAEALVGVELIDEMRDDGELILDDARDFVRLELGIDDATYVLSEDGPIEALELAAGEAGTLILGSDDVPWYDRLLRTRIAGYLALRAPCPVIVVPEHGFPTAMAGDVVVTIDGLSAAEGPLRFAFEQAAARDGVLHVLNAVPPATMASDVADLRANMSEVLAGWREQFPDVAVMEGWSTGRPKDVLRRATQAAELVVVGRPRKGAMPFPISRPLAMDVLRHANCPVAVVSADYRGV